MPRSKTTGRRHEITYEYLVQGGTRRTRATCVCGKLATPFRFTAAQAEEDARDHMHNVPSKGKPPHREVSSPWAESLQY